MAERKVDVMDLTTHQFQPEAQSGGMGRQNWINLTMRCKPRVNQDSFPRFRFFG